jgi:hypothetical protein
MCQNSCIGFTGPFENLDRCAICDTPQWNDATAELPVNLRVSHSRFPTLPLGAQNQALYRDPTSAMNMRYLWEKTQELLNNLRNSETGKIPIIEDIAMGWDYLGAILDGDIKENDVIVMASLDGAQLFKYKESDCWIYIWVILNLAPNRRYRKMHILPGGFIPGPKKPKNLVSFLVVGLHHLAAIQNEGLSIWNVADNTVF